MSEAIQIHFSGELIPGFDIDQVKISLARELAVELPQVEHWFDTTPCMIRQCTSTAEANYFSKLCQKAGIRCQLVASAMPPDDSQPLVTENLSKVQIINSDAIKFAKQQQQVESEAEEETVKALPNSLQHIFFNENNWWFPAGLSLGLLCLVIAFFIAPDENQGTTTVELPLVDTVKNAPLVKPEENTSITSPLTATPANLNPISKSPTIEPPLQTKPAQAQPPGTMQQAPKTYLQLASFDQYQGAQRFIEQLQPDSYSISVVEITNTGTIHHKVLVGPFLDDASYQSAKQAFTRQGAPGFRVKL